ncbi:hypothetical protein MU694_08345 [Pseudomonas aeruginosa]|uniref:hypothetical protein n=1 Tax=Pseudomonas aeruginosa TaxID=287 RepID=UPI00068ABF31|nr:hypothetical protein [Pseudomonas aeruginosa]MDJ1511523.1 hypothetical protein [Pseudomonas aeruginosa]UVN14201.1 hypothetical protein FBPa47_0076 [Pseudomonas phage vB_PeaS_FBPa47]HCF0038557.1 hypothetical protein [Pseudomonas aeruginosa]
MSNEDWNELDESYRSALSGALETAHPAVEQAGGDERAACNLWIAEQQLCQGSDISLFKLERNGALVSLRDLLRDAYQAGQARAALAQPSPVRSSLLINGYQLRAALDFIAPDGTAEQLESETCIEWRQQDADFLEAGLYAFCAEYPEEGGVLLDEEPTTAQPSPLQSEQAEAERPEVVAYLFVKPDGTLSMDAVRHKPSQPAVAVMTVAQYERIVGELRAEIAMLRSYEAEWELLLNEHEQQRDVALARVAELERQEPVDVPGPGPDEIHQMAFEEGQPAEDGDGYLFSAEEFDLLVQRLLDSCATPVARAQHSVPDDDMSACSEVGDRPGRGTGATEGGGSAIPLKRQVFPAAEVQKPLPPGDGTLTVDPLITLAHYDRDVGTLRAANAKLEKELAMARDAAAKGDAARHAAGGMEMEIRELKAKLAELEKPVNRTVIRDVFLRNGFTIKDGHSDLKPYVYAAAEELLRLGGHAVDSNPVAQAQHSDQSELRRIAVALTNPLLNGQEASDLMVRYEALTMPDHIIALIDSQAQYIAPDELRAICMLVAEAGIKYGRGRDRAVASDECREVVDSVLPLEPSPSNSEQHCEPEIMAVAEGVLTFMRSENEGSHCTCCNGPHIFCRYFEGMSDFDDITRKARFRNDLEGRTFRLVLELLPAALSGKEGV